MHRIRDEGIDQGGQGVALADRRLQGKRFGQDVEGVDPRAGICDAGEVPTCDSFSISSHQLLAHSVHSFSQQ